MALSEAIPVTSQSTLAAFCSNYQVPPRSVLKLVFATLLHQYFDLHEFTFAAEHLEAHHEHTCDPTTRDQQVRYASELASTTSIRAAFHLGETDLPSDADLAPLLVNHTTTATQNGGLHANRLTAGLVFTSKATPLISQHVSDILISSHLHTFR